MTHNFIKAILQNHKIQFTSKMLLSLDLNLIYSLYFIFDISLISDITFVSNTTFLKSYICYRVKKFRGKFMKPISFT